MVTYLSLGNGKETKENRKTWKEIKILLPQECFQTGHGSSCLFIIPTLRRLRKGDYEYEASLNEDIARRRFKKYSLTKWVVLSTQYSGTEYSILHQVINDCVCNVFSLKRSIKDVFAFYLHIF